MVNTANNFLLMLKKKLIQKEQFKAAEATGNLIGKKLQIKLQGLHHKTDEKQQNGQIQITKKRQQLATNLE